MIIAINTIRMNWYRVSSALIDEALHRGWEVQCWHAKQPTTFPGQEQNILSREKVPVFKYGRPKIVEYEGGEGLRTLLKQSGADIVVDVDPQDLGLPNYIDGLTKKPLTVLMDGVSNPRLQLSSVLPKYDVYTTPSKWHTDETIRIRSRDQASFLRNARLNIDELGSPFYRFIEKFFEKSWSDDDILYYKTHTVVVGTPSLDDLELVDREEVREKWNIPHDAKVVGYLPSPYDYPLGFFWGDLNMCEGIFQKLTCCLSHRKLRYLHKIFSSPSDIDFVKNIRNFCDRSGAKLIAKLRHSRSIKPYLAAAADLVIGEDVYHPHTVLELFKAADIVFGYTSTGALECVAAGTPYVDIEIPFFPKAFYLQDICPSLAVTNNWDGVVWSLPAEEALDSFNIDTLERFKLDPYQQALYINKFTSKCDGLASARLLNYCESKV